MPSKQIRPFHGYSFHIAMKNSDERFLGLQLTQRDPNFPRDCTKCTSQDIVGLKEHTKTLLKFPGDRRISFLGCLLNKSGCFMNIPSTVPWRPLLKAFLGYSWLRKTPMFREIAKKCTSKARFGYNEHTKKLLKFPGDQIISFLGCLLNTSGCFMNIPSTVPWTPLLKGFLG